MARSRCWDWCVLMRTSLLLWGIIVVLTACVAKPVGASISTASLTRRNRRLQELLSPQEDVQQTIAGVLARPPSEAALVAKGKLFYMYDLEEKFWWRWPAPGTDCSKNGYVGHEHAELSGMGTSLRPEDGLYLTWHFSLFSSLFNRLKRSKRRTLDPEKASLFIIPYDLGENCRPYAILDL
jgi:hypothetical protein